ncbi:S-adenosyl-L-methionine-dependent methyltransferase [Mycena capillaripes]|nr:S-adenosyl-L-methionine-dependent methyltransferase [Mycena capillaripes]
MAQNQKHPAPHANHHELRTAENSAAYLLPKLELMHKSNPRLKLLDVGAGSGSISATLAKAIGPEGRVTATDLKPDVLLRAAAVAEIVGATNIEFLQADVFALPFADGEFDIVHCHQVLCHLKNPHEALREMLRVAKVGGVVGARESDLETQCIWPALPGLLKFHDFAVRLMQHGGGTAQGGRQLLSWALQAGARRDQVTPSFGTWCYSEEVERKVWGQAMVDLLRGGRLREVAISALKVTETELEGMATAYEEWLERDDAIVGMIHGEILIQK